MKSMGQAQHARAPHNKPDDRGGCEMGKSRLRFQHADGCEISCRTRAPPDPPGKFRCLRTAIRHRKAFPDECEHKSRPSSERFLHSLSAILADARHSGRSPVRHRPPGATIGSGFADRGRRLCSGVGRIHSSRRSGAERDLFATLVWKHPGRRPFPAVTNVLFPGTCRH